MTKTKIDLPDTKFHVNIRLYQTVKALKKGTGVKCAGLYRPNHYVIYPKWKVYPNLGTISLAKEKLGVGYITHEATHAAFDYMHKKYRIKSVKTENSERQESMAWVLGYIVKEICNWLNDNKLWK